jgi:uncharacterized membrane protein (DUF4010 family)
MQISWPTAAVLIVAIGAIGALGWHGDAQLAIGVGAVSSLVLAFLRPAIGGGGQ